MPSRMLSGLDVYCEGVQPGLRHPSRRESAIGWCILQIAGDSELASDAAILSIIVDIRPLFDRAIR